MDNVLEITIDQLCPYVRKVGKQGPSLRKNHFRRIFDHELLYCVSGGIDITIKDNCYHMAPGNLILIPPDTPHTFWSDTPNVMDVYWVHFDFIYRKDVYTLEELVMKQNSILFSDNLPRKELIRSKVVLDNGFTFPEFLNIKQISVMKDLFERLYFNYSGREPHRQLECRIILLQIFKIMISQVTEECAGASFNSSGKNAVHHVIEYIQKDYSKKISIKELANAVGFSEDHIGKLFKKEVGMSIVTFMNRIRIMKAKQLLAESDLSVKDIAEIIGFSDVFYFTRVMKKLEGVSPAAWRKNLKHS